MCIVLDERLFDEQVQVIVGKTQLATFMHLFGERPGNTLSHIGNKVAVFLVENLLLLFLT